MSYKTIAVEAGVYEKLARRKQGSESFTRIIDRLVDSSARQGTCADAVEAAARILRRPLSPREQKTMDDVVTSNRRKVAWDRPGWA